MVKHKDSWLARRLEAKKDSPSFLRAKIELIEGERTALLAIIEERDAELRDALALCLELHGARCGVCGAIKTIVRPGKYQCDPCGYWNHTIANIIGHSTFDENGWCDPLPALRRIMAVATGRET